MALLITAPGTDITVTRAAGDLHTRLQRQLVTRLAGLLGDEQTDLLRRVRGAMDEELAYERTVAENLAELHAELDQAGSPDGLAELYGRFAALTAEQFARRGSTSAMHTMYTGFFDRLLQAALTEATAFLARADVPSPSVRSAILASGTVGRRELNPGDGSELYLIFDASGRPCDDHFGRLADRLSTTLHRCRQAGGPIRPTSNDRLWNGSVFAWQQLVEEQLLPSSPPHRGPVLPTLTFASSSTPETDDSYLRMIAILADLRWVAGNRGLGETLQEFAHARLRNECNSDTWRQSARRLATMPVARTMFGWFRVALSGEHRGEFSLEQMAMEPLVAAVRLLARRNGVTATATSDRIKTLCGNGKLGIELSERLLAACQEFGRQRIELELRTGEHEGAFYFNPEELADRERERFKQGLEAVAQLQKLLYQDVTEGG